MMNSLSLMPKLGSSGALALATAVYALIAPLQGAQTGSATTNTLPAAVVQEDREFLQAIQGGAVSDSTAASTVEAASAPAAPKTAPTLRIAEGDRSHREEIRPQASERSSAPKPAAPPIAAKSTKSKTPKRVAEAPAPTRKTDPAILREPEPRRAVVRTTTRTLTTATDDTPDEEETIALSGSRPPVGGFRPRTAKSTTMTTTTTPRYVTERRVIVVPAEPFYPDPDPEYIEIRPRHHHGFFHRLFNDD